MHGSGMTSWIYVSLTLATLVLGVPLASSRPWNWAHDSGLLLGAVALLALAALLVLGRLGGGRTAWRFLLGTLLLTWLAESLGLHGGWYAYHPELRPVLPGGVPVQIPLAWFVLACAPAMLLRGWKTVRPDGRADGRRLFFKSAWSAVGLVACDLALDPISVAVGLWHWQGSGPYFGVPWLNFAGWWLVGLLIYLAGYGWAGLDGLEDARFPVREELLWGAVNHGALVVLLGYGARCRTGSLVPLWASLAVMSPLSAVWLRRLWVRWAACRN